MRSLAVKFTLAFLFVGLVGSVVLAITVQLRTRQAFDRFIIDQNQQIFITNLVQYYQKFGTWDGIEKSFPIALRPAESGLENRNDLRRNLFSLTDAEGRVLFGRMPMETNGVIAPRDLRKGQPIEVDGQIVGWLLFNPALDRWRPGSPEGRFLSGVNSAIRFSVITASAIALVLGGILAYSLTRSLRELTAATSELAKGKLGLQVEVRSKDELGELANSFNQMSTELARSTKLRRQMTADIAHDLRTPLSVLLGYSEALADGKLEVTPDTFAVMHREAQHLSRLVDDLKTLSLADAGELPLNPQEIAPQLLLDRAVEAHRVKANRKNVTLITRPAQGLPSIMVDVDRMAQVIGNLVDNALRYTSNGGEIVVAAEESSGQILLSIKDNGVGIPEDILPKIFDRSYRGDKSRQLKDGEAGLGLSIAKSLVEAQGGSISVASVLGEGATFTIHFPANS